MAAIASVAVSVFLPILFDNVASLITYLLELQPEAKRELTNLKDTLSVIQSFLKDAEERQHTEEAVRSWLAQIRDVAYAANDILDKCATEAHRHQLVPFAKVRSYISPINPKRILFHRKIASNIQGIQQRLEMIEKRKGLLALTSQSSAEELAHTTSFPSSSTDILGRENDKNKIISRLVSSSSNPRGTISVIPLLGVNGVGKTTLAQLVYNDESVKYHFDLRLWVHISREFNVNKIIEGILESIDHSGVLHPGSLDSLQRKLQTKLSGRRYLLVLDNVSNARAHEWEMLRAPLLYGATGSKILLTTRSEQVVRIMSTSPPHRLQVLSDYDCWFLFCQHASFDPNDLYMCSDLGHLRHEITSKCKGLPLAAKAIGFRLRKVSDRSKWADILRDGAWEFSGEDSGILRSVTLSYQLLPPFLKPCFAYCSVFPKGFLFKEEELVQLWMAQNFIQATGTERVEDVGRRYFKTLVELSFFQPLHFTSTSDQSEYTMNDLIHGLAQYVSEECCIVDIGKGKKVSETIRHSSLIYTPSAPMTSRRQSSSDRRLFEQIYACKGLYTLLANGNNLPYGVNVPNDLAKNLKRLRTLDLSNSISLTEIPESIGSLKHLRYLQLGNTSIRRLPNSVGELYNLQTLGLANCYKLEELPKDIMNLRKLRHLDLHLDDFSPTLKLMPPMIGKLTNLQTLSRFVVDTTRRSSCGLGELQNLNDLHGELHISNLHVVLNPKEAHDAQLSHKEYLGQLEFRWGDGCNSDYAPTLVAERVEAEVLRVLEPHSNLNQLKIVGYQSASFPPWVGHPSFIHLQTVVLSVCNRIRILPPLGLLPVLKFLTIKGMDDIESVDCKFCGIGGTPRNFRALEQLHLEGMSRLQVWWGEEGCMLPSLRKLVIKDCVELRQLTHGLPLLQKLVLQGSPCFMGLPKFPRLRSLDVKTSGSCQWIWDSKQSLNTISSLTITSDQLISLPDRCLPTGLAYFAIRHCPQVRALPEGMIGLTALEEMEIEDCPRLLSLPNNGLPTTLQFLSIKNCPLLGQRIREERGQDWHKIKNIFSVSIE